jgi:hypothetical protein
LTSCREHLASFGEHLASFRGHLASCKKHNNKNNNKHTHAGTSDCFTHLRALLVLHNTAAFWPTQLALLGREHLAPFGSPSLWRRASSLSVAKRAGPMVHSYSWCERARAMGSLITVKRTNLCKQQQHHQ